MADFEDEAGLVAQAKTNPQAFGALYERYVQKIYNYVYYRTGNVHDAEDLTAKVFQRALVSLDRYTSRGLPFSAWLYRIAHNLVANWHRDQGRRQLLPLHEAARQDWQALRTEAPELAVETREEQDRLLAAVRRLSPERQQLLVLKFVERLSNAEIGQVLNRSEGAVKSLFHRTLLVLRNDLTKPTAPPHTGAHPHSPSSPSVKEPA
ncbi:MAG: sigma-70 family RNA polymerase sigma factor [Anaerolineales bacterium]|nr:sigma-70 family RNA polymerase sigma factor [Anaerolineales bacterium]